MNTQIVPIFPLAVNGQTVEVVDGRYLHQVLEVKSRFNDWVDQRTNDAGLEEGLDFFTNSENTQNFNDLDFYSNSSKNPGRGRPTVDYWFTVDAAKHVSMMEKTPQGKRVRNYFIDLERDFKGKLADLQRYDVRQMNIALALSWVERRTDILKVAYDEWLRSGGIAAINHAERTLDNIRASTRSRSHHYWHQKWLEALTLQELNALVARNEGKI